MIVQDWASVIVGSFQNLWYQAINALGQIIGALIILIVGLIVAAGIGALVERIFEAIKFDKFLKSLDLEKYFHKADLNLNSARFFGRLVYWFLVIVFLLAASDVLGFYALSSFLNDVLRYIPNVVIAVLIMVVSFLFANFLKKLVKASIKSSGLHGFNFLSALTWWVVVIFGFLTALAQLGISMTILNTVVMGIVAMFALAGGIAFGLGGKDYASYLVSKFREHIEK